MIFHLPLFLPIVVDKYVVWRLAEERRGEFNNGIESEICLGFKDQRTDKRS